jgi:26S proteasome regulatory subunit N3
MPGKTPDKEPVENGGYRGGKDIEMKDKDLKPKGKKSAKEGEDEMTVVVPPSKASKQSSVPPPNDADGDVAMDEGDKAADDEVKVDPVVQTINGTHGHLASKYKPQS